jgi:hypothetical protein
MSNNSLSDNFTDLYDSVKSYVEARLILFKLKVTEKITRTGTYFISTFVILSVFLFALLFLSFAFSFWYGQRYGDIAGGFLISAGFYILLAFIIYLLRKPLFSNNIVKNVSTIIFSEEEENENE